MVVILFGMGAPNAAGCSCGRIRTPCEEYSRVAMIFLGTVTEALAVSDGRVVRARMRVDRGYKGVSEKSLVLFDDGMCDGPDLRVGEQYLMYIHRLRGGEIPSRGCTRSRHVEHAAEDLEFLNGLAKAAPVATLSGQIMEVRDDLLGNYGSAPGAVVEVSNSRGTYTAAADADGRYQLRDLEPGEYSVTASLPGYRMFSFDHDARPVSTSLLAGGCAVVNLALRKQWLGVIAGRVVRSNGEPAPEDLDLTLLRIEHRDGGDEGYPIFPSAATDKSGAYSFEGVAPGRYKIALNRHRLPTMRAPYPQIYWPGVRSEEEALNVEVTDAPVAHRYDFRLPPEPKSATVNGIALFADGRPAIGAGIHISALPDGDIEYDEDSERLADRFGHFSVTVLEGFEYELWASTDGDDAVHSAHVRFSVGKAPQHVTLMLDRPGRVDDDPALRVRGFLRH